MSTDQQRALEGVLGFRVVGEQIQWIGEPFTNPNTGQTSDVKAVRPALEPEVRMWALLLDGAVTGQIELPIPLPTSGNADVEPGA